MVCVRLGIPPLAFNLVHTYTGTRESAACTWMYRLKTHHSDIADQQWLSARCSKVRWKGDSCKLLKCTSQTLNGGDKMKQLADKHDQLRIGNTQRMYNKLDGFAILPLLQSTNKIPSSRLWGPCCSIGSAAWDNIQHRCDSCQWSVLQRVVPLDAG